MKFKIDGLLISPLFHHPIYGSESQAKARPWPEPKPTLCNQPGAGLVREVVLLRLEVAGDAQIAVVEMILMTTFSKLVIRKRRGF